MSSQLKSALIFGATGQDGRYLYAACQREGIEPIGVSRSGGDIQSDVSRYSEVKDLIQHYKPSIIFHLAANSTTHHSALFENHETVSTGTLNILEAVKQHCPSSKVFITGSGVQFKNGGKPISEVDPFEANSAYSVARIQSVYAARYYRSLGIPTYVGYLFHHESPWRQPTHVSKKIALAVQRIASGSHEKLELGDITVQKEWTFAGDVVEAILTLIHQDSIFEVVIGSGKPYTIEYWLQCCFTLIGKDWHDYVTLRKGFCAEYPLLLSNPQRIKSLGWNPKVEIEDLSKIMITNEAQQFCNPD